ncbi:MAG: crossover junction endodeoxyribonuclease RuvC [Candidatus Omnitrophica bacterium]|nr:crossover junction endodeoxyribonuclease RuvC [Candidatus Omnitrophota bacterium]
MRVLGIDPGTLRTGLGILDAKGNVYELITCQTIEASPKLPIPERLKKIHQTLQDIIRLHSPDVLALENVFFGKDVRALVKIGEARACAMLAAAECGIPVVEYPPARIKQAISGNGRATKIQMQQMIKSLFRLKTPPPADAADALAVALCHVHSSNVRIPVG